MRTAGVAILMVLAMASPASAATYSVSVKNFAFEPATVSGRAGESVAWTNSSGVSHNVASVTGMFRSGSADSSFTFTRTMSAGTYPYLCQVHESMTGRLRIRPRIATAPAGLPFTVRWATSATDTGTSFRVHYRVNGGTWRSWFSATTKDAAVFGANSSPVRVVDGATYQFRARSIRSGNLSGYSPAVTYTP